MAVGKPSVRAAREWAPEDLENLADLAELQFGDADIATAAGCSAADLRTPEAAEALVLGRIRGEVVARKALLAAARAGSVPALDAFSQLIRKRKRGQG